MILEDLQNMIESARQEAMLDGHEFMDLMKIKVVEE